MAEAGDSREGVEKCTEFTEFFITESDYRQSMYIDASRQCLGRTYQD